MLSPCFECMVERCSLGSGQAVNGWYEGSVREVHDLRRLQMRGVIIVTFRVGR